LCSHFLYLARRARDAGWVVTIAAHFEKDRERLLQEGFRLLPLEARRSGSRPTGLASAIWTLSRFLAANPGTVLHGFGLFGIVVGSLAGRFSGQRRAVYTITGRGYAAIDDGFTARTVRAMTRVLCRHVADGKTTRWLAENAHDLDACGLDKAIADGRTTLVGGAGVAPDALPLLAMPTSGGLRCAVVARCIWSKGIDTAVEAVALARAAGVDVELTLAGEPDHANPRSFSDADLRSLAEQPGIRWVGHVHDIAGLWRGHHVAVLASRGGEGVPKSLIEAAACGRALITTDVPGCRELAGAANGWIVPPNDPSALASALTEAAGATDLEQRGLQARRAVLTGYTEDANWRHTSAAYENLVGAAKRDPIPAERSCVYPEAVAQAMTSQQGVGIISNELATRGSALISNRGREGERHEVSGMKPSLRLKRAFDFIGAAGGLLVLWPLLLVLLIFIRLTDSGPALFSQTRVGRHGRPFTLYKFRTMRDGTAWVPTHLVDPAALTPTGRILRRFKLDELPQLVNVLRGEMSLVGPRPCLYDQVELIEARVRHGVFSVLPGITGEAQVHGITMSEVERLVEVDAKYVLNRTFWGDLKIIWKTFFGSRNQTDAAMDSSVSRKGFLDS